MIVEVFKEEEDINEVSSPVSEVLSDSDLPRLSSVQGRTTGPTRRSTKGGWTEQEDDMLTKAVKLFNGKNWKKIAECFPGRSDVQCLHRWQKVLNPDLVKGPWTKEEDDRILELVKRYGCKKWSVIAQSLPGRIGKQCRERWHNHLNPAIKKHAWTKEEELALIRAHQTYGNKWAEIAKFLPGRADNSIKNHWNCSVKKKLDSYLASECSGDLLGINASDFYDHDSKEESIKGNVPNNDPGIICSLNQMNSDDGIDTSLGVSVLGVSNRRKKGLQTHSEPAQAGSRCLEEAMDGENELATGIWLERKCPIAQDLSRGLCGKYDNYGCNSGDLHRSAAETELSCGISSGESVMTMHLPENACEPVDYSNTSPRHPGEISLSMSTLSEPPNVKHGRRKCKSQCIAFPITTKRIPESPKRPRHYASPLHESSCMDFFPYMSSSDFGSANGQACRKSKAFTTTQQSEDVSFGTSSCESTKQTNQEIFFKNGMFSSAEKNLQLANSPVCCSPPPSQTGNIYSNGSSPETILRIAAKNFKNTPSIIRKRTHETSKRDHNAANDVCMSEARTGSSNASQGSSHSCDHVLAGRDDLTSEHLPNVKWLSLSSPGVQTETVKSVEKRLEYAFDLEWDDAKAKCGGSATEIGPIASNVETMDNSPGSSGVMSNQNFMLLGLGVNATCELDW